MMGKKWYDYAAILLHCLKIQVRRKTLHGVFLSKPMSFAKA